jgi:hypothetical protein
VSAGVVDLMMDQGEDWSIQIYWTDMYNNALEIVDPIKMDIKNDAGQVIYSMQFGVLEGSIATISYAGDSGFIQLQIPTAITRDFVPGNYFYDLFISTPDPDSDIPVKLTRLIKGQLFVDAKVTNV